MTQPQKQPDKEPESLTKEFNFPGPWIRDYNPAIHGVKPGLGFEKGGTAPVSGPLPTVQDAKSGQLPAYPDAKSGQLPVTQNLKSGPIPAYPAANPSTPVQAAKDWNNGPVQFNANGVYGGEAEKQKGLPAWAWTLISAAVLIIVLLLLFFVILK